jgi:hypothetical protein
MNAIEPKCGNSEKCPKRDTCGRHSDTHDDYQIYASYFIAGVDCHAYQTTEEK